MPPSPPTGRDDARSPAWIRDLVRDAPSASPPDVSRRALVDAVRSFVSGLAFALDIPGQHYSGLSNQELFDILAERGRNFAAPSRQLDEYVRTELIREFTDYPRVPSATLMRQVVGDIILEWIVGRMEGEHDDVPIAENSDAWSAFKRANGFDRRVGVMRGDLLEAVKSAGVNAR